jgi:hypothetical protein
MVVVADHWELKRNVPTCGDDARLIGHRACLREEAIVSVSLSGGVVVVWERRGGHGA